MSITLDDIRTALAIIENSEGSEITLRSGDIELIVRRGPAGASTNALPPGNETTRLAFQPVGSPEPSALASSPPTSGLASSPLKPAVSSSPGVPSATAVPLRAPLSGVIYRAPSPGEPPFVIPGAAVDAETVVCIIDVMKVMNLIKSPVAGKISRIDVEDGQVVAKDDVILFVDPT